jgi:hypothetical protein
LILTKHKFTVHIDKLLFVGKDLLHEDEVQEQDRQQRQDPEHHPRLPLQVD